MVPVPATTVGQSKLYPDLFENGVINSRKVSADPSTACEHDSPPFMSRTLVWMVAARSAGRGEEAQQDPQRRHREDGQTRTQPRLLGFFFTDQQLECA